MANYIVKLKNGSDYLYPYADVTGMDVNNLIATCSQSYTYVTTADCYIVKTATSGTTNTQIKIDGVLIANIAANMPYCFPIKKGQTVTVTAGTTNNNYFYGIKY